ncbi:MAG TPA: ferritin-like domain-containing protein [Candidatus Acidoferrum sp.]|nr:ferritin-like domain-containing protein [Candidatus Acidoferrum sp.]
MANEAKEKLVAGLNDDLALELAGIVRSVNQASTAGGLLGHELRELLQKELPVELQHAQFLADKIAILGGTPTVSIAEVPLPVDVGKMIDEDIATEWKIVSRLRERASQAESFGDIGLKIRLEEMIAEGTDHANALQRLVGLTQ